MKPWFWPRAGLFRVHRPGRNRSGRQSGRPPQASVGAGPASLCHISILVRRASRP